VNVKVLDVFDLFRLLFAAAQPHHGFPKPSHSLLVDAEETTLSVFSTCFASSMPPLSLSIDVLSRHTPHPWMLKKPPSECFRHVSPALCRPQPANECSQLHVSPPVDAHSCHSAPALPLFTKCLRHVSPALRHHTAVPSTHSAQRVVYMFRLLCADAQPVLILRVSRSAACSLCS